MDWGDFELVCALCGHLIGTHCAERPLLKIVGEFDHRLQVTHHHVALLDASRLECDDVVQLGEDKLKLRCPQDHKVGSIIADGASRAISGPCVDQRRTLVVKPAAEAREKPVAVPLWSLVQRREARLCRDGERCKPPDGRSCKFIHIPKSIRDRYEVRLSCLPAKTREEHLASAPVRSSGSMPHARITTKGPSQGKTSSARPPSRAVMPARDAFTSTTSGAHGPAAGRTGGAGSYADRPLSSRRHPQAPMQDRPREDTETSQKRIGFPFLLEHMPLDDFWIRRLHEQKSVVVELLRRASDQQLVQGILRMGSEDVASSASRAKMDEVLEEVVDSARLVKRLEALVNSPLIKMSVEKSRAFLRVLERTKILPDAVRTLRAALPGLRRCHKLEMSSAPKRGVINMRMATNGHDSLCYGVVEESQLDYEALPVLPTLEELVTERGLDELPLNEPGPWPGFDTYVDTHFRLLREDYIEPLREVLLAYLKRERIQRFVVYKMRLQGHTPAPLTFKASFTILNRRNIERVFAHDNRLKYGSLVALMLLDPKMERVVELCCATVASYDRQQAIDGKTTLVFTPQEGARVRYNVEYIAIESPAYFMAFEHVLCALRQRETLSDNPLSRIIVIETATNGVPSYLRSAPHGVDLSAIKKGWPSSGRWYPECGRLVDAIGGEDATILDPSQLEAVEHCLTHRVANVVGPPGTGKSFTGVHLTRLIVPLLDTPLLVLTYTNHALDQFLQDLVVHFPDSVRCGRGNIRTAAAVSSRASQSLNSLHEVSKINSVEFAERSQRTDEAKMLMAELHSALLLRDALTDGGAWQNIIVPHSLVLRTALFKPPPAALSRAVLQMRKDYLQLVREIFEAWCTGTEDELKRRWRDDSRAFLYDLKEREHRATGGNAFRNRYAPLQELEDDDATEEEEEGQHHGALDTGVSDGEEATATETFEALYEGVGVLPSMPEDDSDHDAQHKEQSLTDGVFEGDAAADGSLGSLSQLNDDRLNSGEGAADAESEGEGDVDHLDEVELERLLAGGGMAKNLARLAKHAGFDIGLKTRGILDGAFRKVLSGVGSLWDLSSAERRSLMKAVVSAAEHEVDVLITECLGKLDKVKQALEEIRVRTWVRACTGRPIVGLTSTFAAQHLGFVRALKVQAIIMEEAGELLESQVMAAIASTRLEHLISIGDHRQLRPKLNAHHLHRKRLDISLFERLVEGGRFDKATLQVQLRMRREIADLTRHMYKPHVRDHSRVAALPPIRGIAASVFFLTHEVLEDRIDSDALLLSKSNTHEATMVIHLGAYLLQQGYAAEDMAFLSAYVSQVRIMRAMAREQGFADLQQARFTTVDNFQGEEARIVILSLVRSNKEGSVGFTKIENRMIVSLSRAIEGFFIVGNGKLLRKQETWEPVITMLDERGCYKDALPLVCENHTPPRTTYVQVEEDPSKLAFVCHGGCTARCNALLPCGHACRLPCHRIPHNRVPCSQPCANPKVCEHGCPKKRCHGDSACEPCTAQVTLPGPCGHQLRVPCHVARKDITNVQCSAQVHIDLDCGHRITTACNNKDAMQQQVRAGIVKCRQLVDMTLACGHRLQVQCCDRYDPSATACKSQCRRPVEGCGHDCTESCSSAHTHRCSQPCRVELLCGHGCQAGCSRPHTSHCRMPCEVRCAHNRVCTKRCSETCVRCREPCYYGCYHTKCTKMCFEPCDRAPCQRRCSLLLSCGHVCFGLCGEWPCPPCPLCTTLCNEIEMVSQLTFAEFYAVRAASENAWRQWRRPKKHKKRGLQPWLNMSPQETLYQLPEYHCVFLTTSLERALREQVFGSSVVASHGQQPTTVRLLECPTCRTGIFTAARFERLIKRQMGLYQAVKKKLGLPDGSNGLPLDPYAVQEVLDAGLAVGRWFACPVGHVYRIEDKEERSLHVGISRCPEPQCQHWIGASRAQLQPGNRFIQLDSDKPAYETHGMKKGMPQLPPSLPRGELRITITANHPSDELLREHYEWVTGHFKELFPHQRVRDVELILNPVLVERYERRKVALMRLGAHLVEERLVYHGTDRVNHAPIVKEGLKVGGRGVGVAHGASYGQGIYVGCAPDLALRYARGHRAFLFCSVLMGRSTTDNHRYTSGGGSTYDAFDGGSFCVVHSEDQVLPCYIVHE